MPRPPRPEWLTLGSELRTLRSLAGLTTRDVAQRTGLSVARASRIETGHSLLSLPELDAWAGAIPVDPPARARLRSLVEAAHVASVAPFRTAGADIQANLIDIEASARRIVTVQPQIVPALLQTVAYARAVLELVDITQQDIRGAIATRLRRQEILHDSARTFEFLLTEAALRWPAGTPEVMAAQYDRLAQLSRQPNIKLGILPLGQPVRALPWSDVNLFAERADNEPATVDIELPHAEVWVTDPVDVAVYQDLITKLWQSALTGDDVRALLTRLMQEPRTK